MGLAVRNTNKFRQPIVMIPKKITEIFYASYPINNQSDLERSPLPVSLWNGYMHFVTIPEKRQDPTSHNPQKNQYNTLDATSLWPTIK